MLQITLLHVQITTCTLNCTEFLFRYLQKGSVENQHQNVDACKFFFFLFKSEFVGLKGYVRNLDI